MWALPRDDRIASSAWQVTSLGDDNVHLATLDESDGNPVVADTPLDDPPVVSNAQLDLPAAPRAAELNRIDPSENDSRPAPPTVGLQDQQCNTIQIVKYRGQYFIEIDGVISDGRVGTSPNRHWLPRFKDVYTQPVSTGQPRRAVGPLCVGIRLEEGEVAPLRGKLQDMAPPAGKRGCTWGK